MHKLRICVNTQRAWHVYTDCWIHTINKTLKGWHYTGNNWEIITQLTTSYLTHAYAFTATIHNGYLYCLAGMQDTNVLPAPRVNPGSTSSRECKPILYAQTWLPPAHSHYWYCRQLLYGSHLENNIHYITSSFKNI